jgi:hypothetical protein
MTILHNRSGMIYHLNRTAAVVLAALLDGGTEAATATLCARYTTSAQTAHADVAELLDALLAHRLVVRQ